MSDAWRNSPPRHGEHRENQVNHQSSFINSKAQLGLRPEPNMYAGRDAETQERQDLLRPSVSAPRREM